MGLNSKTEIQTRQRQAPTTVPQAHHREPREGERKRYKMGLKPFQGTAYTRGLIYSTVSRPYVPGIITEVVLMLIQIVGKKGKVKGDLGCLVQ